MAESLQLSQVFDVLGQLRQARAELDRAQALLRSEPEWARQHGRSLTRAEQEYSNAASLYQGFRALVGLEVVPGLSGGHSYLGQVGLIFLTAAAAIKWAAIRAALGVLAYWVYSILKPAVEGWLVKQETQKVAEGTKATQVGVLEQQRQSAIARGDIEEARRLAALIAGIQAGMSPTGQEIPWGLLALGAMLLGTAYLAS